MKSLNRCIRHSSLVVFLCSTVAGGCGGSSVASSSDEAGADATADAPSGKDGAVADGTTDAPASFADAADGGPPASEAGPDATSDGGEAGAGEAGPDAASDAAPDSGPDAGPEAGPEAGLEAGTDASDAGPDASMSIVGCQGTIDSFWSSVVAYVPCTGQSIVDVSQRATLTIYNTPSISTTPANAPGGASCSLNSGGAYATANGFGITIPSAFGTGDFTVEISVYQTAWSDPNDQQSSILVSSSTYAPAASNFPALFSHETTDQVQFIAGTGGQNFTDPGSTLNTWESYAISRVSGTDYVFRDGTLLTTIPDTSNYTDTLALVGHQANGPFNALMGSVGQIRITGAGRYTASYTPCTGGFATQ